jgi:hypothetical protein
MKSINENAECTLCKAKFALHMVVGRKSSVTWKQKEPKLPVQNKAPNNNISSYLRTKNMSEVEKQPSLAAQGANFACRTAVNPWTVQPQSWGKFSMINLHVHKQNTEQ